MDLRYKILLELKSRELETKEFVANDFLSRLPYDLGTIKRALIELRNSNYIQESNVPPNESAIDRIIAINNEEAEKLKDSSLTIRLILTLEGRQFLIKDDKLNIDYELSRWQKICFWPIALMGVLSLALSIYSIYSKSE